MAEEIYLDYNSTTPVDEDVLETMLPFFNKKFGNASSNTHAFGREALRAVTHARNQAAALINATPDEMIFTSGSTESINLAIKGVFENYSAKGNHIITAKTEHKAVLDTCAYLEKKHEASITYLNCDMEGLIDTEDLKQAFTPKTIMVCIMLANNETGVIQPMDTISKLVHEHNCILMSDITQAAGKIAVDVNEYGIDIACISAHKMYGPKGTGALYIRRKDPRVSLAAQIHGGGHEKGLRSGTLNVPGIVGLGKACELAARDSWDVNTRVSALRGKLEHSLLDLPGVRINGSTRYRLYNTSNICFSGKKSADMITKLRTIAVSMGSACTSAIPEPSHVLKAMGLSDADVYSSIRFSLGKYTTEEEIKKTIDIIKAEVYGN